MNQLQLEIHDTRQPKKSWVDQRLEEQQHDYDSAMVAVADALDSMAGEFRIGDMVDAIRSGGSNVSVLAISSALSALARNGTLEQRRHYFGGDLLHLASGKQVRTPYLGFSESWVKICIKGT